MAPTYAFVGCLGVVIVTGLFKTVLTGGHPEAASPFPHPGPPVEALSFWLLMKAFSNGCTAITGVEAVSNGVQAFREPRVKNARATLTTIIAILILLLAGPLMALVALAIRLDSPGPVLFRQKRFGFNNERIDVFKFRSLYHDQADPLAAKVVTRDDPRVTRVGRFIRKTSLDELPQLFNVVFKSNLSLVGPRPHAVQGKLQSRLFDEAVDGYFARHRVKPGITGWAQINGWRGEVDSEEKIQKRVEFDLYYIENWSVLFDLFILLKTPLALMTKNENAY